MSTYKSKNNPNTTVNIISPPPKTDTNIQNIIPQPNATINKTNNPPIPLNIITNYSTTLTTIYNTPSNLPTINPNHQKKLITCTLKKKLTTNQMTTQLKSTNIQKIPTTKITIYHISYQTKKHKLINPKPYTLNTT